MPTPASLVLKYAEYPSIRFLHTAPGALWAALIPVQLVPCLRRLYPSLHRSIGWTFSAAAMLMSLGMLALFWYRKQLSYDISDFSSVTSQQLVKSGWAGWLTYKTLPMIHVEMIGLGVCFASSLLIAVRAAQLKQYMKHRRWIFRHAATGLWVAVQRLVVIFGLFGDAKTPEGQLCNFR